MNIESGYFYHIYNRGNNSQKIFYTRENYLHFLRKMKEHLSSYASVIAWCLMPNHFHWVVFLRKSKILGLLPAKPANVPNHSKSHTMTRSHSMTNNIAILGIGSNINADENISKMLKMLGNQVEILKISSFVKTKPIGIEDQPDFTNGAVKIKTSLAQDELKRTLKNIEDMLGRDRSGPKFGPRIIDIDIVIWNGKVVDEDYYSRDFLKKSVDEIS